MALTEAGLLQLSGHLDGWALHTLQGRGEETSHRLITQVITGQRRLVKPVGARGTTGPRRQRRKLKVIRPGWGKQGQVNVETHLFQADLHRGSNTEVTLVGVDSGVQV